MKSQIITFLIFQFFTVKIYSQQFIPIDLLAYPNLNRFSFSGMGGANGADLKSASLSAQISFDLNILNTTGTTKKGNSKLSTFGGSVKCNPLLTTRILNLDSFSVKKLPFADNEHLVYLSVRYQTIIQNPENKSDHTTAPDFYRNFFGDIMVTPYKIKVDTSSLSFTTLNLHAGLQLGILANWIGPIGFLISAQTNLLCIFEENERNVERVLNLNRNVNNFYLGLGAKLIVQINDVGIFAEARQYLSLGTDATIRDITKNPVWTVGVNTTGTVLSIKDKSIKSNRWN
jgi:hypothetical protein